MAKNVTQTFTKQLRVGREVDGTPEAITSLTTGVNSIIVTTLELVTGDVVKVEGLIPSNLNGFHIASVTAGVTSLVGCDSSSAITTDFSKATIGKVLMSDFCRATSMNTSLFKIDEKDNTTLCDDVAQTTTEVQPGSTSLNIFYEDDDKILDDLIAWTQNSEEFVLQVRAKGKKTIKAWRTVITKFDYESQINEKDTGSIEMKFNSHFLKVTV